MRWKIKYLTINVQKTNLKTIDVPVDKSIQLNDIKGKNILKLKTVDDICIMKQLISERNSHHLN